MDIAKSTKFLNIPNRLSPNAVENKFKLPEQLQGGAFGYFHNKTAITDENIKRVIITTLATSRSHMLKIIDNPSAISYVTSAHEKTAIILAGKPKNKKTSSVLYRLIALLTAAKIKNAPINRYAINV